VNAVAERAYRAIIDEVIARYARSAKSGDPKCEGAGGKWKYNGRKRAQDCADEMWRALSGFSAQKAMYPYVCPHSGNPRKPHWHLTSLRTASMPEVTPIPTAVLLGQRRVLVHCGPPATEPSRESDGMWFWKPYASLRVS